MLKILIIISLLGTDGITNSTLTYLENMDRTDLDFYLGVASGKEDNAKKQIERVNALKIPLYIFPSRSRETLEYCKALNRYLKNNKFDIIHVMGNSATMAIEMFIAKKCSVPGRIVHCRNTKCKYKMGSFLLKPMLYHAATDYFACGKDAGRYLYGNRKFVVIPNGKQINKFLFHLDYREKIRQEMNVQEKKVIVHVGKFTAQKNHIFLIDVFEKLCKVSDNYELWLIGEGGEMEKEIHARTREYGLVNKVQFLGYRNDVERILSAADIAVLPSLYEGLPNVVIEWQMAGLPCLLSDTITMECKVMSNVNYLSIKSGIEMWCNEIEKIQISDRNDKQDMIMRMMSDAGYDIRRNAEQLRNIYYEILYRSNGKNTK